MTKKQNSIAHRKTVRANNGTTQLDKLKAVDMALDIQKKQVGMPQGMIKAAHKLYSATKD